MLSLGAEDCTEGALLDEKALLLAFLASNPSTVTASPEAAVAMAQS